VRATLFAIAPSHPSHAARLMLERKGIEHRVVNVPPGTHAVAMRLAGFRGGTVPAIRLDRRRVQGSLAISRALDEIEPDPPLFPADPGRREEVVAAERWGESELQGVPRRLTRWATLHKAAMREHMARETGIPLPKAAAFLNIPAARHFARKVGADDDERVRRTLVAIPDLLDRVEALIAAGTLGGPEPNAADFQIAPTIRSLLTFGDLEHVLSGRPAAAYARAILPEYPTTVPAGMLPAEWLAELRA
jgi:glutathione S-transferase